MFVIHHVGGRAGTRGFPHIPAIEQDIVSVLYDADPECIEQVAERNAHLRSRTISLPICLGATRERRQLNLTYDPYASSLLTPRITTGLYSAGGGFPEYDYPLDSVLQVVRHAEVEVRRLDELSATEGVPAPDFLSIDVQGGELDVLKGCGNLLDDVVGVLLEVEFEELYVDQPLFPEVHEFMRRAGFVLVNLDGLLFDRGPLPPIGARARSFWGAGEALYLRPPDGRLDDKIALTALAFGYAAWAYPCKPPERATSQWQVAVQEFHELCSRDESARPAVFTDRYSIEESFARFDRTGTAPLDQRWPPGSVVRRILRSRVMALPRHLYMWWLHLPHRRQRRVNRKRLPALQQPYREWAHKWGFTILAHALDERRRSA